MSFDVVAGSVLAEYAERRDELEERHERDDLVSFTPRFPPPARHINFEDDLVDWAYRPDFLFR